MTLEERIEKHRKMAESYHQAYAALAVKDGSTYDEWQFSDDAQRAFDDRGKRS